MFKNPYLRVALISALLAMPVMAGAIKTWVSGDTLTITDLNANMAHMHNSMVGGHGARLVDADVSATAAIGYTKIQNGRGIARAWAEVAGTPTCPTTVTISESLNVTEITCAGAGVYVVTLNYTANDNVFAVVASSGSSGVHCAGASTSTTTATITCVDLETPAVTDTPFQFVIYDAD
jgi:hypothetical protein